MVMARLGDIPSNPTVRLVAIAECYEQLEYGVNETISAGDPAHEVSYIVMRAEDGVHGTRGVARQKPW